MAKLKTHILSELRGSVGKEITFKTFSRRTNLVMQTKPTPRHTRTEKQNQVRDAYQKISAAWKDKRVKYKQIFENIAKQQKLTAFNTFLSTYLSQMNQNALCCFGLNEDVKDFFDYSNRITNLITTRLAYDRLLNTGKHVLNFDGINTGIKINTDVTGINAQFSERTYIISFKINSETSTYQIIWEEGGSINGANIFYKNNEIAFSAYDNQINASLYFKTSLNCKLNEYYTIACIFNYNEQSIRILNNLNEINENSVTSQIFGHPDPNGLGILNGSTVINITTYYTTGGYYFRLNGEIANLAIINKALTDTKAYKVIKKVHRLVEAQ